MKRFVLFQIVLLIFIVGCGDRDEVVMDTTGVAAPIGIMPLDEVLSLKRGTSVIIRTVVEGDQPIDLKGEFLEVQAEEDTSMGFPLYLCETQDPHFQTYSGIVAGMSGSPVMVQGRIIGALSYGFDSTTNPPYLFGVTPIEFMLRVAEKKPMEDYLAAPKRTGATEFRPLKIPVSISGARNLSSQIVQHLQRPNWEFFISPGGGKVNATLRPLAPGDAIALNIAKGPILNIDAHGTVTWVDGGRIYAFGHPMFWEGKREVPFRRSWVHKIISSNWSPFKYSSGYGENLGVIDRDFSPGISGVIGESPKMFPVIVKYTGADGQTHEATHYVAQGQEWAAAEVYLWSVATWRDESSPGTATGRLEVSFQETAKKLEYNFFASGNNPFVDIYNKLSGSFGDNLLAQFADRLFNNIASATIKEVRIEVTESSALKTADIISIKAKAGVKPGEILEVDVGFKPYREKVVHLTYSLEIPADFPAGEASLMVGPKAEMIDVEAVGLESREDIPDSLDALIDQKASEFFSPRQITIKVYPPYAGDFIDATGPEKAVSKDFEVEWVVSGQKEAKVNIIGEELPPPIGMEQ